MCKIRNYIEIREILFITNSAIPAAECDQIRNAMQLNAYNTQLSCYVYCTYMLNAYNTM